MSVLVALTAQSTVGVSAIEELSPRSCGQLDAVFGDIGVDRANRMLFSRVLIETVADYLEAHPVPLVVDRWVATSGARLLEEDAVGVLVARLFPLATVVTPNLMEAKAIAGVDASRRELAERLHALGAPAVIVTGGHGDDAVDHLYDGVVHLEIPVERHDVAATHGAGCTHSATLAALLARGECLPDAARGAAAAASRAVAQGLAELGSGEGPVDVLGVRTR